MTKIFFDEPSDGKVNAAYPALSVINWSGPGVMAYQLTFTPTPTLGFAPPVFAVSDTQPAMVALSLNESAIDAVAPNASALNAYSSVPNAAAINGVNLAVPVPAPPPTPGIPVKAPPTPPVPPPGYGVFGYTNRPKGVGVIGVVPGEGSGVVGVAQGDGVVGLAALNGNGVRGASLAGAGVWGHSEAGPGVRATSVQAEGLVATATATNAPAVRATNDSSSGFGVSASSANGVGILANSDHGLALKVTTTSGSGIDVSCGFGSGTALKAYSFAGNAVDASAGLGYGVTAWSAGCGVMGRSIGKASASDPAGGCGVFGNSLIHIGVCGSSSFGTGVFGQAGLGPQSFAGAFKGNVSIEGFLYKYASLFSIDHPLSPRKRLNHAAIEAPEYKTLYDGVATLNSRGEAKVRMAKWFDALNGNVRYQLTPLGAAMPDLHVAKEMRKGMFTIAGGRPRGKVCWQVTGVRRDKWARANPLKVEQPKSDFAAIPAAIDLGPISAKAKQDAERANRETGRKQPAKSAKGRTAKAAAPKPPSGRERDAYLRAAEKTAKRLAALAARIEPAQNGKPAAD